MLCLASLVQTGAFEIHTECFSTKGLLSFQLLRYTAFVGVPLKCVYLPGGMLQPSLGGAVVGLPTCPSFKDLCFLSLCGSSPGGE